MNQQGNGSGGHARKGLLGRVAVPLAATAMLLSGLILLAQPASSEDFGWVAYTPLDSRLVVPQGLMFMSAAAWTGAALIGAGLLVLAFWSGYRTGRQVRDRDADSR